MHQFSKESHYCKRVGIYLSEWKCCIFLKNGLDPTSLIRKALHWMIQQERVLTVAEKLAEVKDEPPRSTKKGSRSTTQSAQVSQAFFWTKEVSPKGQMIYKNLATNSAFKAPPLLPRGGILADDMGLGKTITTIALMLAQMGDDKGKKLMGKNLVVCPLSVLYNWSEQLKLHAPSLRVRTYHGPDRDKNPKTFCLHDVTLTTYDACLDDMCEKYSKRAWFKMQEKFFDLLRIFWGQKSGIKARGLALSLGIEQSWMKAMSSKDISV